MINLKQAVLYVDGIYLNQQKTPSLNVTVQSAIVT